MTHPTPSHLVELAERVEAAIAEPGTPEEWEARFMLDAAIHRACADYDCGDDELPAYTGSIDAAATLVPGAADSGGERWRLEEWNDHGVHPEHVRASAWVAGAHRVYAATPALALCAAALRARAATEGRE